MSNKIKQNTFVHLWIKGEDLKKAVDKYTNIFTILKFNMLINSKNKSHAILPSPSH